MKRYIFRGLLFAIPVVIYVLIIAVVDPYNLLNIFHIINDQDKFAVIQRSDESSPRGNILWKTIRFKRNPTKIVIIGDSQGKDIRPELIKKLTGVEICNLCFPGASFQTMFETFWYAAAHSKLEKVYFQVAFMNYNAARDYDLFHFAMDYQNRPYEYFTSKEIFFDSFANLAYAITRNPALLEGSYEFLPPDEMEKLAQFRLNLFFKKYVYPAKYKAEFLKIKEYCEAEGIELNFIFFPVYKGVDDHLEKVNLTAMKARFKQDIKSYGKSYDLDQLSEIKQNRDNFIDYFHPKQEIIDSLTRMIWRQNNKANILISSLPY